MPSLSRSLCSLRSLLSVVALALPALAQTVYYSASPAPTSVNTNPIPLGPPTVPGLSRLTQVLMSRFGFANAPVRIDSLSLAATANAAVTCQRLVVRLGYSSNDILLGDFPANRSSPMTTVLDIQQVVWPVRDGQWTDLGLQTPFVYTPALGNLLVEIQATSIGSTSARFYFGPITPQNASLAMSTDYVNNPATSGGGVPFVLLMRVGEGLATTSYLGRGCNGSTGSAPALGILGSAQLGGTAQIVLSNARPSALALLLFGFSTAAPLPQDLTALGMPGCLRYVSADNIAGLLCDGSGVARYPLPIPAQTALVGTVLYSQYFAADATANAAGFAAANYGRMLIGQ